VRKPLLVIENYILYKESYRLHKKFDHHSLVNQTFAISTDSRMIIKKHLIIPGRWSVDVKII
jgi:hypothetical protein